jgi:colicin import membrane protein
MMDRRHKKCLLGSALLHAVLLLVLLVGPGFLARKPPALPVLDVIPARVVDQLLAGGGNPAVTAPPPPPAPPVVQPLPRPEPVKTREPEPPPPPPRPAPSPKALPVPEVKKAPPKTETKTESRNDPSPKTLPKVSTKLVTRNPEAQVRQREAERQAALEAAAERARRLERSRESLSRRLSDSVSVEVPGPGGASVANWAQLVQSLYDRAWIEPAGAGDGRAAAQVSVTIARDGTVISASLTSPSGNAALDQSIRAALDRVRQVPPFPPGAREERRTVIINFNLLAKRLPG